MTSRKNVGDIRHLVVLRVMIEVCDTGLTDDQYGDLLEYLKHDEVLWSDENKNDFYNVATKLAKNGLKIINRALMKIYLRVHKDQGYHVAHLWSKHIKEQIIETVNFACDDHDGCIGEPALFPTFWQQEIHSRRLYVGAPKKCKYWLNPPMYALSFVWEKADFDFEDDYYWLCDNAKLPYDFTCQPRINDQYTDDVYIGSYVKGQTEPLTLPGLLFDPEYEEDGEVLADNMFVELKKNRG